jgi:hypothetical protein
MGSQGNEIPENDEYLAKERELKDFQELRVRRLEALVREKTGVIERQEDELATNAQDIYRLKQQTADCQRMVAECETRLDRARVLLEQKDGELAAARV